MSVEMSSGIDPQAAPVPDRRAERMTRRLCGARADELGRLTDLAAWTAGLQGTAPPEHFRRIRAVLVATPADPDGQVEADDTADTSADGPTDNLPDAVDDPVLDALAAAAGAGRRVVDVVTAVRPTRTDPTPELPVEEFDAAFELGRFIADEEADSGTGLLVVGTARADREADLVGASALAAALLGREPVAMIGTDTGLGSASGLDDRTWTRRVAATRDALRRTRPARGERGPEPDELMRLVAGPRIAVLAGLLGQAAARRTPVLLDGTVACVAGLAAARLFPGAEAWWQAATRPPEPAARAVLDDLGLTPVLDLGIRSGDGAAGLALVPLLVAAVDVVDSLARGAAGTGSPGSDSAPPAS